MPDIHIDEVHTEMEITESIGSLGPAELKKIVALVMAQLKAHQHQQRLRDRDDRLHNSAYISDLTA